MTLTQANYERKVIDDTDSPYTTQDEDVIYANTSGGPVTVTLATSDATEGNEIAVVNVDGSNPVTVNTEGSETIGPAAESSKEINNAGDKMPFTSDATNWDARLAVQFESIQNTDHIIASLGG